MKIENYSFNEMLVVQMMEKHPELLKVFTDQNFSDDLKFMKALINDHFLNHKARVALKKVFKVIQSSSDEITQEYSQMTIPENKINPVDGQRFYAWNIEETNGEYSYNHKGVCQMGENKDSNEWLTEHTRTFYSGDAGKEESEGVFLFNGELTCTPYNIQEITASEFEVVKKYI